MKPTILDLARMKRPSRAQKPLSELGRLCEQYGEERTYGAYYRAQDAVRNQFAHYITDWKPWYEGMAMDLIRKELCPS